MPTEEKSPMITPCFTSPRVTFQKSNGRSAINTADANRNRGATV